ncbi:MAG: ion transporter [Muribaculaceae bacterium]|nr:ion transporter [Muribaculaceae bacterium]
MKEKIQKFLENKYVDNFLISLILLNFILFIFQTDMNFYSRFKDYINIFEFCSIFIFTIEYFLRVLSIKNFRELFKPMMLVDFLAVFPYYLTFVTINTIFLRILRVFRLLRIAKLARYTTALERMKKAFLKHKDEIIVTTVIFIIGLTTASIAIYFAEHNTDSTAFESIPKSFWWSIITFTSVGYGDTYPTTTIGKFIGAITAIMGVGLHALLIGVVGAAFIDATKKDKEDKL